MTKNGVFRRFTSSSILAHNFTAIGGKEFLTR
jgi:hypothetical protein